MRAAVHGTAILLAAAAFTAGCTAPTTSKAAHRAGGASARPALASAERRVHCGKPWHYPSARLPTGFVAEAAVLCVPAIRPVPRHGHVVFTERVADRGLAPLVAALRRPSAEPTPGVMCPLPLPAPVVFLIDRDGQITRPKIPTEGCGSPLQPVLAALQHMPWVTVHGSAPPDPPRGG
jgi:hypothetical protein